MKDTRIETANYYAENLGSGWVIRDKRIGEVACYRNTEAEAVAAMNSLETNGTYA